jgi:hypothetical protein
MEERNSIHRLEMGRKSVTPPQPQQQQPQEEAKQDSSSSSIKDKEASTTTETTTTTATTKKKAAAAKTEFVDYQDSNPAVVVKGPGIPAEGQIQDANFSDSW